MGVGLKFTSINGQSGLGRQAPSLPTTKLRHGNPASFAGQQLSVCFPNLNRLLGRAASCLEREVEKAGMNSILHPLLIPPSAISN